jgi:hypothetical protein
MKKASAVEIKRVALLTDLTPVLPGNLHADYVVLEFNLADQAKLKYFVIRITNTKQTIRQRSADQLAAILFTYCGNGQAAIPQINFSLAEAPVHWNGDIETMTPEVMAYLTRPFELESRDKSQRIINYLYQHGFDHLLEAGETDQARI